MSEDGAGGAPEADIQAAVRGGQLEDAVTLGLKRFGPELLGFLVAAESDEDTGAEIFSQVCEDIWRGIGTFRGESSFRTWAYTLARNAAHRHRRDPHRRRRTPISAHPEIEEIAGAIRTKTLPYLRSEVREGVARLRERIAPEDRMLLILRVDRQMSWNDAATILEGAVLPPGELRRRAAALRQRFKRLVDHLRDLAREEGLLPEPGSSR